MVYRITLVSLRMWAVVVYTYTTTNVPTLPTHVCIISNYISTRDGRISDPAIRIRSDFHYPAKSASGQIAYFTPDRIGANY